MKSFNLAIDSNFLWYKSMFIAKGYAKRTTPYLSTELEQGQLMRKVSMDFVSDIKTFQGFDKIVMVKDSKSWRKTFDDSYKAHREKKSDIAWETLFTLMDDFLAILATHGVIVSVIDGAEGDDLLYYWSDYFTDNNQSSIILTGDRDLTQLVNFDEKKELFTVVYNNNSKNRKIVAKKGFTKWIKAKQTEAKFDMFDMDESILMGENTLSVVNDFLDRFDIEEIDPAAVVLNKVLCGDDGDNIPALLEWKDKSGNKKRITDRHYQKVYNNFIEKYSEVNLMDIHFNKSLKLQIKSILEEMLKTKIDDEMFFNNFNRNMRLVYLNRDMIPESLSDDFFNYMLKSESTFTRTSGLNTKYDLFKSFGKYNSEEYSNMDGESNSFTSSLFNV